MDAHGWNGVHVVLALEAQHFCCVNHIAGVKGLQAVMFLTVRVKPGFVVSAVLGQSH